MEERLRLAEERAALSAAARQAELITWFKHADAVGADARAKAETCWREGWSLPDTRLILRYPQHWRTERTQACPTPGAGLDHE